VIPDLIERPPPGRPTARLVRRLRLGRGALHAGDGAGACSWASNEELETINEELHSANEELETMNDELHSRSSELRATRQRGLPLEL